MSFPLVDALDSSPKVSGNPLSRAWPLGEWLLIGVAAPLLLFPGIWSLGGLLLIGTAWIVRRSRHAAGVWRLSTPADPAIALILLTALVGVMVSVDSALSLNRATVLLLGWLLYESTVVTVARVGLERGVLALAGVVGLLLAAMSLTMTDWAVGILLPIPGLYDQLPQINLNLPGSGVPHSGGLFNPRTVAGGAVLLWPINGALAVSRLPVWQRLLHALTAFLLIGVILLSQSPQAILALLAALWVFFFWWVGKWGRVGLMLLTFVTPLVALIALAQPAQRVPLWGMSERFIVMLLDGRAGFGLVARFELWVRAVSMIRTAPLTGIGLNNYAPVMDAWYPGYVLGPEAHAHNLMLQTLTDQGILGLLGLLLFVGITLWVAVGVIRTHWSDQPFDPSTSSGRRLRAPLVKLVLVAVIATIAGWLTYGLFEVLSLGHKPGVLLWLLLALPHALARRKGLALANGSSGALPFDPSTSSGRRKLRNRWRHPELVEGSKGSRLSLFVPQAWFAMTLSVVLTGVMIWQTGYLTYNSATVSAQQALLRATRQPDSMFAQEQLDLAESRLGPQPHLSRLRALLQVESGAPEAAAGSFRQLAALELKTPLWWWAPAPLLSGQLSGQAAGLASIYQHWHTRFPERVEPIALLAYTYADGMGDKPRAINLLSQSLKDNRVEHSVLLAILADLTDE